MAKLRTLGWLVVTRHGVCGRVTEYCNDKDKLLAATRDDWPRVGPDFDIRMQQPSGKELAQIVPLPIRGTVPVPKIDDGSYWSVVQGLLHVEDPATYGSWLHALRSVDWAGGRLTLQAPSRFHAAYIQSSLVGKLMMACHSVGTGVTDVVIID